MREFMFITISYFIVLGITLVVIALDSDRVSEPTKENVVINVTIDMNPSLMHACAKAFVKYGFHSVDDYQCKLVVENNKPYVALYGPDYNDPEYKRSGKTPPSRVLGKVEVSGF